MPHDIRDLVAPDPNNGIRGDKLTASKMNEVRAALRNTPTLDDIQSPVALQGVLTSTGDLPADGNTTGDAYLVNGIVWVWDGSAWSNQGSLTQGEQGEPAALRLKGTVATTGALPTSGNVVNDVWIVDADSHGYGWTMDHEWVDLGEMRGPQGPGGEDTELRARMDPGAAGDDNQTLGWNAGAPSFLRIREADPSHPRWGATFDGTTDDTAEIQACINETLVSSVATARIALPPGTAKITSALSIPYTPGLEFVGSGRGITTIKQYTNNTGILEVITDPNVNHLRISDMLLGYNTQQTTSNTSSRCIYLTGDANAEPFQVAIERIWFNQGYRGIVADTSSGLAVPWGVTLDSLTFTDFTGSTILSTDGQGKPIWLLRNIFVDNQTAAAGESCIDIAGAELVISGLDIERWDTYHLVASGSLTPVLIDGYHMETSTFGAGSPYINSILNSGFIARNVSLGSITNNAGELYAFNGDGNAGAVCIIHGIYVSGSPAASIYPLRLDNGATGYVVGDNGSWTGTPVQRNHAPSVAGMRQHNNQFYKTHGSHTTSAVVTLYSHPDELQLVDTTAGAVTIDLDVCANFTGKTYQFKRIAGANNVIIDADNWGAGDTIDGAATKTITTLYGWITIYCDGSNWHLISSGGTIT